MHFHDPALLAPTGIYNSSFIVQAFHESAIKSLQQVKTQSSNIMFACLGIKPEPDPGSKQTLWSDPTGTVKFVFLVSFCVCRPRCTDSHSSDSEMQSVWVYAEWVTLNLK